MKIFFDCESPFSKTFLSKLEHILNKAYIIRVKKWAIFNKYFLLKKY